MKAAPFTLRVEALEGRLLMAADVPAVWPTETPLMAMDNSAQIETLTSSQSLARVVSLSVEHSASDLVLNIQLSSSDQPKLVGIVGGASAWTDSTGQVQLKATSGTARLELTIADHASETPRSLLQVSIDAQGRLVGHETAEAEMIDHAEMSRLATTWLGVIAASGQGGAGAMAQEIHHGAGVSGELPSGNGFSLSDGKLEAAEASVNRVHPHSTAGMAMNGPTAGFAQPGITDLVRFVSVAAAPMSSHGSDMDSSSPPAGESEAEISSAAADSFYSEWPEEGAAQELPEFVASLPPDGYMPVDSVAQTSLAVPLHVVPLENSEPVNEAASGELASPWKVIAALAFAVTSLGGAFYLDRRGNRRKSRADGLPALPAEPVPIPIKVAG